LKNVLIADDNDLISPTLAARHGRESVEMPGTQPVDFVVTDQHMPSMVGYALVTPVNKNHPRIPDSIMTGDCLSDIKPRFSSAVVNRFVPKSFNIILFAPDIASAPDGADHRHLSLV